MGCTIVCANTVALERCPGLEEALHAGGMELLPVQATRCVHTRTCLFSSSLARVTRLNKPSCKKSSQPAQSEHLGLTSMQAGSRYCLAVRGSQLRSRAPGRWRSAAGQQRPGLRWAAAVHARAGMRRHQRRCAPFCRASASPYAVCRLNLIAPACSGSTVTPTPGHLGSGSPLTSDVESCRHVSWAS